MGSQSKVHVCAEAALSGDLDSEGYFPNIRVRCQDLAHAIRRQVMGWNSLKPMMFWGSNRILQIWCGFPKPQFLTGFKFKDSCWGFIRQCSVGLSQQCFVLKGTGHDWTLSKSIFVRAVWDLAGWHNARFLQMMSSRKCFLAGGMRMMGCGCIKREKDVSIIATDVWFSIESHLNFTWVHPCLPQVADMHLREAQPSSNDWELSLVQGWRSLVGKLFWFKHVFAIFVKMQAACGLKRTQLNLNQFRTILDQEELGLKRWPTYCPWSCHHAFQNAAWLTG